MNVEKFLREVRRLFRTAFVQKFVVMILRAAWLGGAVYIFCWGSHELWDWFSNEDRWIVYAATVSILILLSMLRYLRANRGFIWRLDRTFGFDEQLFTAWDRISQLGEDADSDPGTRMLLESDAVGDFPKLRRKITARTGRLRREVESTIVVLILLSIIYLAGISSITRLPSITLPFDFLPPVSAEPRAWDIFESGIPGDETEEEEPDQQESDLEEADEEEADFDPLCDPALVQAPSVWQQTQDLLTQLGERLCCGSATLGLSEALRLPDYAAAADQFSVMAEKINDYSPETRQMLFTAFLDSSVALNGIGQLENSALFAEASSALMTGTSGEMAESLDALSVLMQQTITQQRCITIADWHPEGNVLAPSSGVDPADLPPVSGDVDFYPFEDAVSGATVTGGEGDLEYFDIPMEDEDVVEEYFSPD